MLLSWAELNQEKLYVFHALLSGLLSLPHFLPPRAPPSSSPTPNLFSFGVWPQTEIYGRGQPPLHSTQSSLT